MAESTTVVTLRTKQAQIQDAIERYERKLAQARADLAHVTAALTIFEASGDPVDIARYANLRRLFRYREMFTLMRDALAREGPLTTLQLTERVMKATRGHEAGFVAANEDRAHLRMEPESLYNRAYRLESPYYTVHSCLLTARTA